MDKKVFSKYEERAKIIKAMSHPSRLFIIEELQKQERCVSDLTEMIGADVSTISKHLDVLKNSGLVNSQKRGLKVFYSLSCPCILDFIGCIEKVIQDRAEEHIEIAKLKC